MALAGLGPAQAATDAPQTTQGAAEAPAQLPVLPADAPVTTANGTRTLVVDPNAGLAATGAKINVQGKGFDTDHGLYVAVCADGSGAPADLSDCVGGAIPDGNTTQAWAHITTDGQGSGGVQAKWGDGGSFSVTLTLPSVTEGNAELRDGPVLALHGQRRRRRQVRGQHGSADLHPADQLQQHPSDRSRPSPPRHGADHGNP